MGVKYKHFLKLRLNKPRLISIHNKFFNNSASRYLNFQININQALLFIILPLTNINHSFLLILFSTHVFNYSALDE